MYLITIRGRGLTPERYYNTVVGNSIYTIVLVPREEREINKLLIASGMESVTKNEPQPVIPEPKKRIIIEG
jgi:hypothetical protein